MSIRARMTRGSMWLLLFAAVAAFLGRAQPALADGDVFIVVSIGDSIASGEGAPDVDKQLRGGWSGSTRAVTGPSTPAPPAPSPS